jgi:pyruvate formate-lyase/glycerol dehydratase family glycyl radical enzyme
MLDKIECKAQNDAVQQKIRKTGDIPEIPRLTYLREDILHSNYHLCTQKASLMTAYFERIRKIGSLRKIITAFHFKQFTKTLERTRRDIPQKKWQVRLGNFLNELYLKLDRADKSDNLIDFSHALQYTLRNMPLTIYEHELIVGNPSAFRIGAPIHPDMGGLMMLPELDGLSSRPLNPIQTNPKQIKELHEQIFPFWFNRSVMAMSPLYSQDPDMFNTLLEGSYYILTQFSGISHVTPDYPTVLKLGFNGILKSVENNLEHTLDRLKKSQEKNKDALEQKITFYKAAIIVANAAIEYGRRWKVTLEESAEQTSDPKRKAELKEIASMFKNIPANPPSSFHEAVQMVFITHVILHQENFQHGVSFGRMDQYLYPYYKKDILSGKLTPEKATEIMGCFICKAGELLPLFFDRATEYFSGLSSASGITLGGKMPDGKSSVNDLSYLILLAYDQVRLRQPNFHVRIDDTTPSDFRHLCYEVLKKGGGIPAFFNDNTIIPALKQAGISNDDAEDYAIVGCVEWGVQGKSFPAAGAVFINLAMALQLALHDGRFKGRQFGPKTGPVEHFTSMEVLLKAFQKQLINLLSLATQGNNAIEITHAKHRPTPFLSIVVEGCIENGAEVNAGGSRYNSTGCQGVGLADVIDSFSAIEQIVFKEHKLSLKNFIAAVDNNFEQHRDLRTYILNKVPKYGENSELSDTYAKIISGMYTEAVMKFENPRNGNYFPGFWTMTTHMGFGTRMPALPSGRRVKEALSNGASPCNGRDRQGPTASLSSASNLDNRRITNGYALNQKLSPDYIKGESGNILLDGIILGYFKKGGMQIQFNVMDHTVLADAKEHPEKYPDLVVRVSGYSAYFNDLTEAMKEELINRTLHCATEGNCCT